MSWCYPAPLKHPRGDHAEGGPRIGSCIRELPVGVVSVSRCVSVVGVRDVYGYTVVGELFVSIGDDSMTVGRTESEHDGRATLEATHQELDLGLFVCRIIPVGRQVIPTIHLVNVNREGGLIERVPLKATD